MTARSRRVAVTEVWRIMCNESLRAERESMRSVGWFVRLWRTSEVWCIGESVAMREIVAVRLGRIASIVSISSGEARGESSVEVSCWKTRVWYVR